MSNEIFSESLAFNNVKKRAVSSRSYRVRLPPSNSTSFAAGNTIQFDLPANLQGTYWNSNQCYLKFKVVNGAAIANLDRCGAYGFIRRVQISTSGAQICDLDRYNVLATAMLDADASLEWRGSSGKQLIGTETSMRGEHLAANAQRTYCLPAAILTPLGQTTPHRMIPLCSLSNLQIRYTLEEAAIALVGAGASYSIQDVEMVMMLTELSPGAQAQIDQITGRRYDILATSFMHSGASLAANAGALTANLGFSMSSLERVIISIRPTASQIAARYSLGNRCRYGLSQYSLNINSEQYPARPILVADKCAEVHAESLIADHSLVNFNAGNAFTNGFEGAGIADAIGVGFSMFANIQPRADKEPKYPFNDDNPTGASAGNAADVAVLATPSSIGTFLAQIELESGLSDGKSSHIYSGISTLASTVQLVATFDGTGTGGASVDVFANYTVLLSLNMAGTGVWSVSV
jgi:hypothetical protein